MSVLLKKLLAFFACEHVQETTSFMERYFVTATLMVEDTWGYPRMRAFSYIDLVQKMESNLDQIHIQPFPSGAGAKLDDEWFQEKLNKLGISIKATDFDLHEATLIADFVARIMQTIQPARPIPGHVTVEINKYLQLSRPLPKWTVLVDNTGEPVTWHIQTLQPSRSFLAFVKEERQYYVYRIPDEIKAYRMPAEIKYADEAPKEEAR
ncbi:hypothetical protein AAVH_24285 [Aphelenchoides avenae]|nr:hypothetical protein AAVH_24285 [Aphelenchus avenae]